MRSELTDALIRTIRVPESSRCEIWDARCEGLVLRVSDKGKVTFHARARGPDGRKRFARLGEWPHLSLKDARRRAGTEIDRMRQGADPAGQRREERQLAARLAAMPTLQGLMEAWATVHARDTSPRYRTELVATVRRGCGGLWRQRGEPIGDSGLRSKHEAPPDLLSRRVNEITEGQIATVIQMARARGDGEARHLVRALRRLFGFALAAGHVQVSPVDAWLLREKGGRRTIPWLRDAVRERVLTDVEIARFWSATAALASTTRAFARTLLLTACRSSEISGLVWREVHREPATDGLERCRALLLPGTRTKNRHAHRVPLGALAEAELNALLQMARAADRTAAGLVFPSMASRVAGVCRALRKTAGFDDWSWHDLRRTAATTMARLGCPREHVEAALNHVTYRGGLVGIYQRYDFQNEGSQALLRWQAHVASLIAESPGGAVVPMRRPR